MKTSAPKPNRKPATQRHPRMTRELAEARALSSGKGPVDITAFLTTLKK